MNARRIIRAEASKIQLAGSPSCVIAATIHIFYSDGTVDERDVDFAPDGLMFEVFQEQISALADLNR